MIVLGGIYNERGILAGITVEGGRSAVSGGDIESRGGHARSNGDVSEALYLLQPWAR